MLRKLTALAVSGLTAAALCGPAPALAQSGNISLELNAARDVEGTCRLIFVVTNNTGADLGDLAGCQHVFLEKIDLFAHG